MMRKEFSYLNICPRIPLPSPPVRDANIQAEPSRQEGVKRTVF